MPLKKTAETEHRTSRGQFEIAGAGVLHKAMAIIDAVAASGGSARVSDLSTATGMPLGTLHRLLSALVSERMLKQDARNKTYLLGSRISELSTSAGEHLDVGKMVDTTITELNRETGESVAVALVEGDQVVYRAKRDGNGLLRISVKMGERQPLHATAVGKSVLAFMDPDQFRRAMRRIHLARFTDHTIIDQTALHTALADIRSRGVALEDEEHYQGVKSIAVPLIDRRGYAFGALAITGPAVNLAPAKLEAWTSRLLDAAQQVSVQLGGDPPMLNPLPPEPDIVPRDIELKYRAAAYLGSSPLWDHRNGMLYWIDVLEPSINLFDPATRRNEAIRMDDLACGIALHRDMGKLVVALRTSIGIFDLKARRLEIVATAATDFWEHRFNKGGCDAAGRFWTSNLHMGGLPGAGCLFRLDADGSFTKMDTGLTLPNALAFSPDSRKLYLTDSAVRTIFAYDYDLASGTLSERRELVKIAPNLGRPAGLAVDRDGALWSTHTDGWRITRYSPEGAVISYFGLPVPSANGCGFGDADLGTLYISTARDRLSPRRLVDAPLSGSLFAYRPAGVAGAGASRFGEAGRF